MDGQGNLVITAIKEDYDGAHFTSARMKTYGKFSFQYGSVEVRSKLPYGKGIWPAFWLLGDSIVDQGWPACGEIDIMEFIGDKDPNNVYGSLHAPYFDRSSGVYNAKGFVDDFHTYAIDWYPERIEFYVDDQIYNTVYKTESEGHWPFEN